MDNRDKNILHNIKRGAEPFGSKFTEYKKTAFARFPIIFVLLSTFGVVATLYGFEKVIDKIPFFANNPFTVLLTGLIILFFTGTLYKKLS